MISCINRTENTAISLVYVKVHHAVVTVKVVFWETDVHKVTMDKPWYRNILVCEVHVIWPASGAYEPPEGRRRSVQVRNIERAAAVTSDYVLSLHVTMEWRSVHLVSMVSAMESPKSSKSGRAAMPKCLVSSPRVPKRLVSSPQAVKWSPKHVRLGMVRSPVRRRMLGGVIVLLPFLTRGLGSPSLLALEARPSCGLLFMLHGSLSLVHAATGSDRPSFTTATRLAHLTSTCLRCLSHSA